MVGYRRKADMKRKMEKLRTDMDNDTREKKW
jgi:hypothetical protein